MAERKDGESIMYAKMPVGTEADVKIIADFETLKETVAGLRTIRKQKQLHSSGPLFFGWSASR